MNACVVTIAHGSRYSPLLGRMLTEFRRIEDEIPVLSWVNSVPPGAPTLPEPYTAYGYKPWAMKAAADAGYDILIWLDAACYPVANLAPLIEHVAACGYYVQANGWKIGQWTSDAALAPLGVTRDEIADVPDISTMAMGLDVRRHECRTFIDEWCGLTDAFPGFHTNDLAEHSGFGYRNVGHVSDDPNVLGHRHDQTVASVLAWRRDWDRTPRPIFADYWTEVPDPRTLIVNRG